MSAHDRLIWAEIVINKNDRRLGDADDDDGKGHSMTKRWILCLVIVGR